MATFGKISADDIIRRLWVMPFDLTESEVHDLCIETSAVLLEQRCLLKLKGPVNVCGAVYGDFASLIHIFNSCQTPADSNYLFMGNFVDFGPQSVQTACLLLAYKLRYPESFHLLRGRHEEHRVHRHQAFYDQCKRMFNVKTWKRFQECFRCLPFAAVICGRFFCVSSGLSPGLDTLEQIEAISRPIDIPDAGVPCDLLFSEPAENFNGWDDSYRGKSFVFGPDVIEEFVGKHGFDMICRSGHAVSGGYEFIGADQRLVSICSAPDTGNRDLHNAGAVMKVGDDLTVTFHVFRKHFERKGRYVFSRDKTHTSIKSIKSSSR